MLISAIVAMSKNRIIGKDNQIPWHLPADLKYFKKTTLHHHIIMGRKCYESIGKPLPKRVSIIITRNKHYKAEGCVVLHSLQAALDYAKTAGETEAFIIGGGEIYKQSMDLWDKLYLTEVDTKTEGDIFFPELELKRWTLVSEEQHIGNKRNIYNYIFKIYRRKK